MPIGYVEQGLGYGRQEEMGFILWRLQDGLVVGQAAMVFTEVGEEAVVRDNSPQPSYVCDDIWITGMLCE